MPGRWYAGRDFGGNGGGCGRKPGQKLLVPTSACGVRVLGVREAPLGEYLAELTERLRAEVENQSEI